MILSVRFLKKRKLDLKVAKPKASWPWDLRKLFY